MPALFMVRAQVSDPAIRKDFDRWYGEEHLPDALRGRVYYHPVPRGQEAAIGARLEAERRPPTAAEQAVLARSQGVNERDENPRAAGSARR